MKKVFTGCAFLLLICLLVPWRYACSESQQCSATLSLDEWTWEAGASATFSGTVTISGSETGKITLQLEAVPEQGQSQPQHIVFVSVNNKRVKVKKQSDTYTLKEPVPGETIPFAGSWLVPAENVPDHLTIRLRVLNQDNKVICETEIEAGGDQGDQAVSENQALRIPLHPERILRYTIIAAALFWTAAILRMILTHRKMHLSKGGKP